MRLFLVAAQAACAAGRTTPLRSEVLLSSNTGIDIMTEDAAEPELPATPAKPAKAAKPAETDEEPIELIIEEPTLF